MKDLKLIQYFEEGELVEADDGKFCAGRIKKGYRLDFAGIAKASDDFLDSAFEGLTPEEVHDFILNPGDTVSEALADWVERQVPTAEIEKTPSKSVNRPKLRSAPSQRLTFEKPEFEDERYTPTRLVHRLEEELRAYIESAYPLSDPILIGARRQLLKAASDGHLLAQDPYIETTPRYKASELGYKDLGLPGGIGPLFDKLAHIRQSTSSEDAQTLLFPGLYEHQATALVEFLVKGRDVLVSTGTGSGKTECFLLPMLARLWTEAKSRPQSFQKRGIRALVLYPMNALVNDQLSRLRLLFGDPKLAECFPETEGDRRHPLFGMYTGRTPYPGPREAGKDKSRIAPLLDYYTNLEPSLEAKLRAVGRYPAKDLEAFYNKSAEEETVYKSGKKEGQPRRVYNWKRRLHSSPSDRELLTRHEMIGGSGAKAGHAPDILVTNYSMLEYMLMRPFERPLFDETAKWLKEDGSELLLVLDEAHMYRGAKGAEVAFLLRRLRARLGLHNHPEKLRVIATSASLGSDEKAYETMRRFAADLTGKAPEGFVTVTGTKQVPSNVASGSESLGNLLADLDLEKLHSGGGKQILLESLSPIFQELNQPDGELNTESEILRHLYSSLKDQPILNLLLKETSESAQSLTALSERMFPGHSRRRKATEVLLTLGSLARQKVDEPGLLPTRVHVFFRGLHALYACLNSRCPGRQAEPGQFAPVGKLFDRPRTSCDACEGRVLELASCRNCGSPFLYAHTSETLSSLSFLWGEAEGPVSKIELYPQMPRYATGAEEILVDWRTGFIDSKFGGDPELSRSLWIARDRDGRVSEFPKCPNCQPPEMRSRSRISDFRTRGEQPFTVLLEAQFAEQPPQKHDVSLPNRGRKVLVFSDGRQKAARLAPALERSHARDLFRQVMVLAADALEKEHSVARLGDMYASVLWVCVQRGIDLFPDPADGLFKNQLHNASGRSLKEVIKLAHQGKFQPTQSYAHALFSELTDRFYSIPALGFGVIEEDPLIRNSLGKPENTPLSQEEAFSLLRVWIQMLLEQRRFLPPGADPTQLGEGWERPEGLKLSSNNHFMPLQFSAYVERLIGEEAVPNVLAWLRSVVTGTSGLFQLFNDLYFVQPDSLILRLRLDKQSFRCVGCARLYTEGLGDTCPACLGNLKITELEYLDARMGFYRRQLERARQGRSLEPFGLVAAEHSAQLTGRGDEEAFNKTELYELRFQDIPILDKDSGRKLAPIDVLSCTTTMEVGIDIGSLCGVALRNVPPQVANYQQRSGRAGRRGRAVASVLTFAHGTSHDAEFFNHPDRIISGEVLSPVVYIENQQVLSRHINAYLIQRYFHSTVTNNTKVFQLSKSLGTVEEFLTDSSACSLSKLKAWLNENGTALEEELRCWAPNFSHGRDESIDDVEHTIQSAISSLLDRLKTYLPIEQLVRREDLDGVERECLERVLGDELLDTLIGTAVLPRYAFPQDVVAFWVAKKKHRGGAAWQREFEYQPQRDLQIALTEYAPGSSLTIDKLRFKSAAIYSPYQASPESVLERQQCYVSCRVCQYVSLQVSDRSLARCPACGEGELLRQPFVIPPGFAPDINAKRSPDRGQGASYVGQATKAQLQVQAAPTSWDDDLYDHRLQVLARSQKLVVVNKGIEDGGFLICPACGRTEPRLGFGELKPTMVRRNQPQQHVHPIEQGQSCNGHAQGPFFLGHEFPTDVLLLQLNFSSPIVCNTAGFGGRAGRTALVSLIEALCQAASRRLQIDEGELGGNWSPTLEGQDRVFIFFYDLLPGGAGYTRLVQEHLSEVFQAAEELLSECDCETSCYRCLRHYGNHFDHGSLDRRLGLSLLRFIRYGETPTLSEDEKQNALQRLSWVLDLKGIESELQGTRGNSTIPLVVKKTAGGEIWVDAHHPLITRDHGQREVMVAAFAMLNEFCCLDAHELRQALPLAVQQLGL